MSSPTPFAFGDSKRPASVEAILHPPRIERIREWAYLAGIGIIAFTVGAFAIWIGNTYGMDMDGDPGMTVEMRESSDMDPDPTTVPGIDHMSD